MKSVITQSICCDVILPLTDYKKFIHLMKQASERPQWLRHSFIVVTDGMSIDDEKAMHDWYYESRVETPMPEVTIIKARRNIEGNINEQYISAMVAGDNPYVYFQDENDDLPINIDKSIYFLHYNEDVDMAIGKCETFLHDGTPIEVFPMTDIQGEFLYDCYNAMMLFPSYAHPLSSVMRKSLFEKEEYVQEGRVFHEFAYYDFIMRCLRNDDIEVEFMPFTIKISRRSTEHAVTMSKGLRQRLVEDARLWISHQPDGESKEFQTDILQLLEKGEITTFKEIDARVEDYLDKRQ